MTAREDDEITDTADASSTTAYDIQKTSILEDISYGSG